MSFAIAIRNALFVLLFVGFSHHARGQFIAPMQGVEAIVSRDVVIDDAGNAYVTGGFGGTADFGGALGTGMLTSVGLQDIFVARYAPGGALLWAFNIGGVGGGPGLNDEGHAVAVTPSGSVLVTGYFQGSADFDPGEGVVTLTSEGFRDAFVASYSSEGVFQWARSIGGPSDDIGQAIAVAGDASVYVAGLFRDSATVTSSAGSTEAMTGAGEEDGFLVQLDAEGAVQWQIAYGGSSVDEGRDLGVDGEGNVYLMGVFSGDVDFDPSASEWMLQSLNRSLDIVLASFTPQGALRWALNVGGALFDQGLGLAVDSDGHSVVAGHFTSVVDFDPGSDVAEMTSAGPRDGFMARYSGDGEYEWAMQFGTGFAEGTDVAIDDQGAIMLIGNFIDPVLPDPATSLEFISQGGQDVLVAGYASDGTFQWAGQLGGVLTEVGNAIAVGPNNAIYVTGYYEDRIDIDPGQGMYEIDSQGGFDSFLVSYAPGGSFSVSIEDPVEVPSDLHALEVYPNPSSTTVTVSLKGESYTPWRLAVIDLLGREVFALDDIDLSDMNIQINTNSLPAGTYIVKATGIRSSTIKSFVVAH